MNSKINDIYTKRIFRLQCFFFIPTSLIRFQRHHITGFVDDAYLAEGILFPYKKHSGILSMTKHNSETGITRSVSRQILVPLRLTQKLSG
jgi:hypothetical protein